MVKTYIRDSLKGEKKRDRNVTKPRWNGSSGRKRVEIKRKLMARQPASVFPEKTDWTPTKCQVLWAKTVMAYAVKENTGGNNTDQIFTEI